MQLQFTFITGLLVYSQVECIPGRKNAAKAQPQRQTSNAGARSSIFQAKSSQSSVLNSPIGSNSPRYNPNPSTASATLTSQKANSPKPYQVSTRAQVRKQEQLNPFEEIEEGERKRKSNLKGSRNKPTDRDQTPQAFATPQKGERAGIGTSPRAQKSATQISPVEKSVKSSQINTNTQIRNQHQPKHDARIVNRQNKPESNLKGSPNQLISPVAHSPRGDEGILNRQTN